MPRQNSFKLVILLLGAALMFGCSRIVPTAPEPGTHELRLAAVTAAYAYFQGYEYDAYVYYDPEGLVTQVSAYPKFGPGSGRPITTFAYSQFESALTPPWPYSTLTGTWQGAPATLYLRVAGSYPSYKIVYASQFEQVANPWRQYIYGLRLYSLPTYLKTWNFQSGTVEGWTLDTHGIPGWMIGPIQYYSSTALVITPGNGIANVWLTSGPLTQNEGSNWNSSVRIFARVFIQSYYWHTPPTSPVPITAVGLFAGGGAIGCTGPAYFPAGRQEAAVLEWRINGTAPVPVYKLQFALPGAPAYLFIFDNIQVVRGTPDN